MLERALRADVRKGIRVALHTANKRLVAKEAEFERLRSLYIYETELARASIALGLDEVGRGSLAGPLAVGAVVLPSDEMISGLDDSKKIVPHKRESIAAEIKKKALAWSVSYIEADQIDAIGISACLRIAFLRAIASIETAGCIPEVILLDGNALALDAREINVIRGDARCASIAAASIIAKVERDAFMKSLSDIYPAYGFASNKGYASNDHIATIQAQGLSPQHRRSFCTTFSPGESFLGLC